MPAPQLAPSQVARRLAGRRVWVSRNLAVRRDDGRPVWSVRSRVDGRLRVVARTTAVTLTDVECRIRRAGQRRALLEGQRNVHAFVVGTVAPTGGSADGTFVPVRYDLFGTGEFVDGAGAVVTGALAATLDGDGLRLLLA